MAGADKQQAPIEVRGEALCDILHVEDAAGIILEELLDLVEHDQGAVEVQNGLVGRVIR